MSKHQFTKTLKAVSQRSNDGRRKNSVASEDIHSETLLIVSPEERSMKRRIIVSLLFAIGLTQSMMLMVVSFMPLYTNKHYSGITNFLLGLIVSNFEVAAFIFSPIIGNYQSKIGRKNTIVIGNMILALSTALFGLLVLFENQWVFFGMCMLVRFIQGIGGAMVETASFSLITIEFQKDSDKYIGYAEVAAGIGLTFGPVIGSVIFQFTSYLFTFVIYGGILLIGTLAIQFGLPQRINQANQYETESEQLRNEYKGTKKPEITYWSFLLNLRCVLTLIGCIVMQLNIDFLDSILAQRMQDDFGLDESVIGYVFAIPFFIYTIGCPFVSWLSNKLDRRVTITIAFSISSISLFFTGPSKLLNIPEKLWIILVGYSALSIGCLFFFIPSLPEVIQSVHQKQHIKLSDPLLNDKASGIYNSFYFLGAIIAPPLGGLMNDMIGYRLTNDCFALFSMAFTLVYFTFNIAFCQPVNEDDYEYEEVSYSVNSFQMEDSMSFDFPIGREIINNSERLDNSRMKPSSYDIKSILLQDDLNNGGQQFETTLKNNPQYLGTGSNGRHQPTVAVKSKHQKYQQ